ncbi:MAG: DUF6812 domain-containing protein [Burkholderiales bacterium]
MKDQPRTKIVIFTEHFRIKGSVELLPGARITDYILEAKAFFAVTQAEVWTLEGHKVLDTSFMNVNRNHVVLITPGEASHLPPSPGESGGSA